MALLGSLAVAVVGDIKKLKQGFKEAKGEVKSLDKEVARSGLGLQQIAKYGTLAGAAIVSAFGLATVAVAKSVEKIDLLAKQTGVSREALQGLAYAAQQEGTSIEALGTSLARLARNLYDASNGTGEAKDTFKDFGIAVRDSDGNLRSSADVLIDLANKMKTMTSETEMQALAIKTLGRSGAEMVPFLRMGGEEIKRLMAEAEKLGYVLDEQTVKEMEAFGDTLDATKTGLAGLTRQLAGDVLPVFNSVIQAFVSVLKWIHSLPEPIRKVITMGTLLTGALGLIGGAITSLIIKISSTKIALATLGATFTPFLVGGAIALGIGAIATAFANAKKRADEFNAALKGATQNANDLTTAAGRQAWVENIIAVRDRATKDMEKAIKDFQSRVMSTRAQAIAYLESNDTSQGTMERAAYLEAKRYVEWANKQLPLAMSYLRGGAYQAATPPLGVGDEEKFDLDKYLNQLQTDFANLDKVAQALGDTSSVAADKASLFREAIKKLIGEGQDPAKINLFGKSLTQLYQQWSKLAEKPKETYDLSGALNSLRDSLAEVDRKAVLLGDDYDANAEKARLFLNASLDLMANGIDPTKTSLGDLIAQYQQYAKASADAIEAVRKLAEAEVNKQHAINLVAEAQQKLAELTGTALPEWELYAQSLEKAAKADGVLPETVKQLTELASAIREAGKAAEEEEPPITNFTDAWKAGLKDYNKDARTYFDYIREAATTTAQAMGDAFGDLFYDSVTGKLNSLADYAKAIFDSVSRAWANMMGNMLAQSAINWLFPDAGFAFGTMGGGRITARANGGPVYAGSAYLVGERGPELFVPGKSGSIIPNGGAGVEVNVINQTGQPVNAKKGEVKFDGQRYVVSVLLDAVDRNVGGIRDVLKGGR